MSMVRSIFAVVFFISSIGSASAADDLKSFLLELTDTKDFSYHLLSEQYRAHFLVNGERFLSLNKTELEELYEEQNSLLEYMNIKNFNIISRSDSEFFTSATYDYDWDAKTGNTNMTGKVVVHSVLEKTGNSWVVLFDAVNQ